ncbi:DNA-binding protein [Kitasatospora sp. NPDC088346]|uniref:DNA-binding protein n=1 Tax=Kitasatospora sp. NPDC088346 TaxID=3364073 RepID=UPI0037F64E44
MTEAEAADLLGAGGVLPPGTTGAGERAVPLTARTYRHPALDGRVVVRLVPGELGPAEDLAAGFLGLQPAEHTDGPDAAPVEVGLGLRQALGFPEWVLVHHPADGHHALGIVPELDRVANLAKSKPKAALDAYLEIADRLAAAVPHFLPTFLEQAGRVFLGVENATYAAQLFTRARKAEAQHGLRVDEDRLDAVFLEYALAGALPVKVLSGYAKELAARVPAAEAFRRFRTLCVRRTAGGLQPSAQMAADLRKLARAAGTDPDTAEGEYLAELLGLPATLRAALGWWKGHRQALASLARRDPAIRGVLLDLMPAADDRDLPGLWLDLLEECGATAGLADPGLPAQERPADGAAGWLERFLAWRGARWGARTRIPALYLLVERTAAQLRAEFAGTERAVPVTEADVDLLDLLLSLDVPVADPGDSTSLRLEQWAGEETRRDLLALAADTRFRRAFHNGAHRIGGSQDGIRALRTLAQSPGGRPMLAGWMTEVARGSRATGLPGLPDAIGRLTWLPGEVLALAEEDVRGAAALDLPEVLARTLRDGVLDELGWPAWDEAAAALVAPKDVDDIVVSDAWPHLIVAGPTQARVIGAEGTVLTHDLRIPANDTAGSPGYHFVDGELLVYWYSRQRGHSAAGYWHTAADRIFSMPDGTRTRGTDVNWLGTMRDFSLPLPGGGRTTGGGTVHPGDTAVPTERAVISDGTSFWVWADAEPRNTWHEYDPATGTTGRAALPGFLADALKHAPAGSTFGSGWLRPTAATEAGPADTPVNGLYGWRTVNLPDGSQRGEDLAGNAVTVPSGASTPVRRVLFPGGDRAQAVSQDSYRISLYDEDHVVTATARTDHAPGTFAEGSLALPPLRYWHLLQPRDPQGSRALRRIDRDTTAALIKAAAAADAKKPQELLDAVRALLPEVGHDALVAGIAGIVRFATAQQLALDAVAERLEKQLSGTGTEPEEEPEGPTDQQIRDALNGLGYHRGWYGAEHSHDVLRQTRALARAVRGEVEPTPAGTVHVDAPALPGERLNWIDLGSLAPATAFRVAVATTAPEERGALHALALELDALGLATATGSAHWRQSRVHLDGSHLLDTDGSRRSAYVDALLPQGDGAFVAVVAVDTADNGDAECTVLHHDPSGRFVVPAPYALRSTGPIPAGPTHDLLPAVLARLADHGPAPWFPAAAEEFARLTGVTETMARLVVAGLPAVDSYERNFLAPEVRTLLGVKVADAAVAKEELRGLAADTRRAVVAALLPAEPDRLWTEGPDVAAAAEVWIAKVGRRVAVPEALLAEAVRAVRTDWAPAVSLAAVLDPAGTPELTRDLAWQVKGDRVVPEEQGVTGFTARTLVGAVALTAWLAHRLPAGDPMRAALPSALAAVHDRLANPALMLDLGRYVNLPEFRKVAGAPTELGEGYERYGAVIMATHDDQPAPGIRTALLDSAGQDPYLPALRLDDQEPFPAETALTAARDPRLAAALADPGDPVAGERGKDGTWWPQDPSRSAPDLVRAVSEQHGLGADAATVYLMLLAMPDPTDRNTARWTGWRPARLKAARAELAATDLVVEATRSRAGRSLFLPGGWTELRTPHLPLETWKLPLFDLLSGQNTLLGVAVPIEPAAALYRRAWARLGEGDLPRFQELRTRRGRRR